MLWCMDSARAAEELVVLTKNAKKKAKPTVATKAGGLLLPQPFFWPPSFAAYFSAPPGQRCFG